MQDFVINISEYAKSIDPDFIIIPQNGIELAFQDLEPESELHKNYMHAIDGFGVEELFYNSAFDPDYERIEMLDLLVGQKKVLVSEFISQSEAISNAIERNYSRGFVCFPRDASNYDYTQIPDTAIEQNDVDIFSLSQVRNYLYLISSEAFDSKTELLNAIAATDFDLVIVDLFFEDEAFTFSEINQIKTKSNGARRLVISYISVGSAEKYRYYWKNGWGLHHPLWLRRKYDGYEDEFWVKFWKDEWREIIYGNDNSYMKKILDSGFDGAYLDNVEAYYFLYYKEWYAFAFSKSVFNKAFKKYKRN